MPALLSSTNTGEVEGVRGRLAILIPLLAGLLTAGAPEFDPAASLYNRADYASAIAVLKQSPADARNLELQGQCYFMLGEFRKATDTLEKAAALDPSNSMVQTWLGRAWGRRAETSFPLSALGYATKTREAFEGALRLNPANSEALGDLFDFYMDAPGIVGGGMDKAAGLLPRFSKYDPVGGVLAEARIAEKKKEFASAESAFRRAIEMEPRKAGLRIDLAQFLSRRGRYEESETAFQQAETVAPDSARILIARADAYIKAGRQVDQARLLLRRYLANRLTPHDPPRWEAESLLKKTEGS